MANEQWESFKDVFDILEKALGARKGVRIVFENRKQATTYTHRIYRARMADRDQSKKTSDPSDIKYGASPYDVLSVKRIDDTTIQVMNAGLASGIVTMEEIT